MKHILTKLLIFITLITLSGCEEKEPPYEETLPIMDTLRFLYKEYKVGEIDQCILNNEIVFCAGWDAYDAPAIYYDIEGRIIGMCNWWGGPNHLDSICGQTTDCEVIYRCRHHETGLPPVDKYHLGD